MERYHQKQRDCIPITSQLVPEDKDKLISYTFALEGKCSRVMSWDDKGPLILCMPVIKIENSFWVLLFKREFDALDMSVKFDEGYQAFLKNLSEAKRGFIFLLIITRTQKISQE